MSDYDFLQNIIQPQIHQVTPYVPGMPIEALSRQTGMPLGQIIKLASNENPDGMSPKAAKAVQKALAEANRYPDNFGLLDALSKHLGIGTDKIIVGNGSNDILDLAARVFLGPGTNAVSSRYAFSIFGLLTQIAGAKNVVAGAKNYGHDLDAMKAAINEHTRLIWIANPNNPTGTFEPYSKVHEFMTSVPRSVIVLLDEAYYEYLDPKDVQPSLPWVDEFPNLIITRTFSKIYGLAGLRVGYGIANPAIIELLNRVRQPFNVSVLAMAGAAAALDDKDFVKQSFERNKQNRAIMKAGLDQLGLTYLPAYGNFITVKFTNAAKVEASLLKSGIIARPLGGYDMPDFLRISVGTELEVKKLLSILSKQ